MNEKVRIGDVAQIFDGPHATPPPCDVVGPFFLGIPQITPSGHIDVSNPRYIAETDYAKWTKRVTPRHGDVVFSYEATLNLYALIPENFKCCLGRRMGLVRPDPERLDCRFLYYYFFSKKWRDLVREKTISGATVERLPIATFPDFEIVLPSLNCQRRIAAILSDYDAAIANCRKQIALLEEAAMRLYREWFGDGKGERGPISKWFNITIGRTPPRKVAAYFSESDGDMKWCSIADIKSTNTYVFDTAEKLTPIAVADSKIHISPPGTILLSFKLTVGRVAIAADKITTNEAIAHFETDDRAFRDYTYCYLKDFKFSTLGSTSSIGTAINSDIVREMPFIKPKDENVRRFSCRVSPLFDAILALGKQICSLTEARDRLLPKLMSGEVTV